MLCQIWVRNEGSGFLDHEARDGDVLLTFLDSFEPSLGTQDKKSFLIVKIPDPPNMQAVRDALVESEFALGPSADEVVMRRNRKYRINWRGFFTASEIAVIEDSNAMLADGQLSSGGTVTSGVVSGKFTIADFIRK
jgi:hypothetical protein